MLLMIMLMLMLLLLMMMLVLLVTLIVSLPIMTHAVKLDMPQNNNPPPPSQGTSGAYARTRPYLATPRYTRDDLLGRWPMCRDETMRPR